MYRSDMRAQMSIVRSENLPFGLRQFHQYSAGVWHRLRPEHILATARLVLTAIALFFVYRAPSLDFSWAADDVLWIYLGYAILVIATVTGRPPSPAVDVALHVVDVAFIGALLALTDASLNHVVGFVAFALVAAALRWNWLGACVTSLGVA